MCADCDYAPECYACMVGVATGPESHNPCCSARDTTFSADGLTVIDCSARKHRVFMEEYGNDRARWECSCGHSGSCSAFDVDIRSDSHINYDAGDSRVDTSRAF